jgi:ubiquinone/menaquinone biosynthesis C-methylase UbiE
MTPEPPRFGHLPQNSRRDILLRMPETASASYVMGHDDRERKRLALQASILNPFTEQLLRRAGISTGMRVLDLGCGVGDLCLIAARLVGHQGSVVAVDIDQPALATAQQRAREQGLANISLVQSRIDEYQPDQPFDAVIGRHILLHVPDPLHVLKSSWERLREGGVAAFHEYDFSVIQPAYPAWPLREKLFQFFRDFFCRAVQGGIGTKLYHLFLEAGFTTPDCRVEYPIEGGADSPFYEWLAESVRSILPRAQAFGIPSDEDLNPDTLVQRLSKQAVELKACFPGPFLVGGFARKR